MTGSPPDSVKHPTREDIQWGKDLAARGGGGWRRTRPTESRAHLLTLVTREEAGFLGLSPVSLPVKAAYYC